MSIVVGQFNESFPPIMDGVANVVKNYAYWLNKKHGECHVITPRYPGYVDDEAFPVLRYASSPVPFRKGYRLGHPGLTSGFTKHLCTIPFDIIHTHSPFSSGALAKRIAKKKDIPLVATFHSKFRDDFSQYFKSELILDSIIKYIVSFFNSADEVWAVNEATAQTLHEYGYNKEIIVMRNGSDIVPEPPSDEAKAAIYKKFALREGRPLLLFVGQHVWQKNTGMIIDALRVLREKGVAYNMLFVGTGYAAKDMKTIVDDYGLSDCVAFAGKVLDRAVLKQMYQAATLFLFPSIYDNAPIVVREAAACCCPSILVKDSNAAEGVTDGYNGFLIEESTEALADRVAYLLAHPDEIKQVGQAASTTVFQSWEDLVGSAASRYAHIIRCKQEAIAAMGEAKSG